MDDICLSCWNEGCRLNEALRLSKVEFCQFVEDNPDVLEDFDNSCDSHDFEDWC